MGDRVNEGRLVIGTKRYSSWSMRGWLAVRLAGLDVEEVVIPLSGSNVGSTAAIGDHSPSGLVPYLEHRGNRVWESLAICEYCAEMEPALWPEGLAARTRARVVSAEMHAGFRGLRQAMPMILGVDRAGLGRTEACLADIARVEAVWRETRAGFGAGGPYLFGARFGAADAMFAPVATRFLTWRPELASDTWAYVEAVRAHPLVERWYADAAAEPMSWRLERYEAAA